MKRYLKSLVFLIIAGILLTGCYGPYPGNCSANPCYPDNRVYYPFGLYSPSNFSRAYYHPPTPYRYYDPYIQSELRTPKVFY